MVVARGEGGEVAEAVEGDGVLGGTVAEGSSVTSDLALSNVVRSLGTEEETVTADDSVSGEGGALIPPGFVSMKSRYSVEMCFTLKTSRKARVWRPGCL